MSDDSLDFNSTFYGRKEEPREELQGAWLLPLSYEWTCPRCDLLNFVKKATWEVTCPQCNKKYTVLEANHAWGKMNFEEDEDDWRF